jgi:hypothetical protein
MVMMRSILSSGPATPASGHVVLPCGHEDDAIRIRTADSMVVYCAWCERATQSALAA